jgi:hypothetical protein
MPSIRSAPSACLSAAIALCAGTALAQPAGHAHVHGAATLKVALDGGTVALELEAPMESLVGFERAPRTAAERAAVAAVKARFADPASLFRLDAAARCTVASSDVRSPLFEAAPPPGAHADLEASIAFSCADPAKLTALDVRLFEGASALARIRVETVGTGGAARRELRRGATTVPLRAAR